jgi:hypothetical protein
MRIVTVAVVVLGIVSATGIAADAAKSGRVLSRSGALKLAVNLANDRCRDRFGVAPFDTSSFAMELDGSRWRWGGLDVHGVDGYSAKVSFDKKGQKDSVEVYLSMDTHDSRRQTPNPERR